MVSKNLMPLGIFSMSRTVHSLLFCVAFVGVSFMDVRPTQSQDTPDASGEAAEQKEDHAEDQDHSASVEGSNSHDHSHDDHGDDDHGGGDSHASEKTGTLLSFDFGSAFCNLVIFLGVLGILSKFVWPVILGGLQAREDKIFGELKEAEEANSGAKKLLAEYQSKLDDASAQVQAMLAEARNDAEASGQRIVDEAKQEAERQRERAIAEIETAKKVALSDLAGQTSDIAIGVAQQVLGRELKAEDHADLIRQSLDRLPSNN